MAAEAAEAEIVDAPPGNRLLVGMFSCPLFADALMLPAAFAEAESEDGMRCRADFRC
jgi:hypothetical protein